LFSNGDNDNDCDHGIIVVVSLWWW